MYSKYFLCKWWCMENIWLTHIHQLSRIWHKCKRSIGSTWSDKCHTYVLTASKLSSCYLFLFVAMFVLIFYVVCYLANQTHIAFLIKFVLCSFRKYLLLVTLVLFILLSHFSLSLSLALYFNCAIGVHIVIGNCFLAQYWNFLSRGLMLLACALKEVVKSCMYARKIDNSSQIH